MSARDRVEEAIVSRDWHSWHEARQLVDELEKEILAQVWETPLAKGPMLKVISNGPDSCCGAH